MIAVILGVLVLVYIIWGIVNNPDAKCENPECDKCPFPKCKRGDK